MKGVNNRLGIFFLFDPQGVVDKSVSFFLESLRPHFCKLVVVVNGQYLTYSSRTILDSIADLVILRENQGFDVWAYKEAIDNLGWKEISEYDELTLLNHTNFGPLYPLEEMFGVMDLKDVDFWGITKHHRDDVHGIEEHIQSHWVSVRKRMICSIEFQNYWRDIPQIKSYWDSVNKHESVFTKFFEKKGFSWDVYVNTDKFQDRFFYPLMEIPFELIKSHRCPILKKKSFFIDYNYVMSGYRSKGQLRSILEWIDSNLNYETDYIWENILRLNDLNDIKNNLNLNYILSSKKICPDLKEPVVEYKIALIICLYSAELIQRAFDYCNRIQVSKEIYIVTNNVENRKLILDLFSNLKCNFIDVSITKDFTEIGILLDFYNKNLLSYNLVCFLSELCLRGFVPDSLISVINQKYWDNCLKSNEFVVNIMRLFESNPRLGVITSPPFFTSVDEDYLDKTQTKLFDSLSCNFSLDVKYSKKMLLRSIGAGFWFRPNVLIELKNNNFNYQTFAKDLKVNSDQVSYCMKFLYSSIAQKSGYYLAWVLSEECASVEIEDLKWQLTHYEMPLIYFVIFKLKLKIKSIKPIMSIYYSIKKILKINRM